MQTLLAPHTASFASLIKCIRLYAKIKKKKTRTYMHVIEIIFTTKSGRGGCRDVNTWMLRDIYMSINKTFGRKIPLSFRNRVTWETSL